MRVDGTWKKGDSLIYVTCEDTINFSERHGSKMVVVCIKRMKGPKSVSWTTFYSVMPRRPGWALEIRGHVTGKLFKAILLRRKRIEDSFGSVVLNRDGSMADVKVGDVIQLSDVNKSARRAQVLKVEEDTITIT